MRNKKLIILFSILAFITLLIVLSSVLFSVQKVYAYCFNVEDSLLDGQVSDLDNNGIKMGRSIFTLNEKTVKNKVEEVLPEVKVVNIERKFPNTVYINYVKIFEYFAFEDGGTAYFVSNGGKILRLDEGDVDYTKVIKLFYNGEYNKKAGETLFIGDTHQNIALTAMTDYLERMQFNTEVLDIFEFFDFRQTDTEDDAVYIKTRSGVYIKILLAGRYDSDNIGEKLRAAMSVYSSDETYKTGGTLTAAGSPASVTYDKNPPEVYNP